MMKHHAGTSLPQEHALRVANIHFLLPLVLEDWCIDNCVGEWSLDAGKEIDLSFDDQSDIVLFCLSRYERFIQKA